MVVVESIGGLFPAYDYIKKFLQMKKHVVAANKDRIAKYGEELSIIAVENGVSLRFEASVASFLTESLHILIKGSVH